MYAQPSGNVSMPFRNFEVIGSPTLLNRGRQCGIAIMRIAELFSLFEQRRRISLISNAPRLDINPAAIRHGQRHFGGHRRIGAHELARRCHYPMARRDIGFGEALLGRPRRVVSRRGDFQPFLGDIAE